MNEAKYLNAWQRYHASYEKRAYKELKKVFEVWGESIPWDNLTEINYMSQIDGALDIQLLNDALFNIYWNIGNVHGNRVGKAINTELKEYTPLKFNTLFQMSIQDYLTRYGSKKIVTINKTYFDTLNTMFANMIKEGDDMESISKKIKSVVYKKSFYKWQALRIARTETTAAANYAATVASDVSGYVMTKTWLSALDERTRPAHAGANKQTVLKAGKFTVDNEQLDYPGGPGGSAGNVINCRCTIAIKPLRDKYGNLVPNDGTPIPGVIENEPQELIEAEKKAIGTYTGGEYRQINHWLNTGDKDHPYSSNYFDTVEELRVISSTISSGLKKLPNTPGTSYRGMYFTSEQELTEFLQTMETSDMTWKSFLSSSSDRRVAEGFMRSKNSIMIHVDGYTGKDIKHLSQIKSEDEILFDLMTKFRVEGYFQTDKERNIWRINLIQKM